MPNLLCIDIGNSLIKLGFYKELNVENIARLKTDALLMPEQLAVQLQGIFGLYKVNTNNLKDIYISSVVPSLGERFCEAVKILLNKKAIQVSIKNIEGIKVDIDMPSQLGTDMLVAAVAAKQKYKLPVAVFSLGTASTMFVIDKFGVVIGTTITAGLQISLEALNSRTAQLPYINIEAPDKVIGKNSVDSMKSGIVYGAAAMIDGIIIRASKEIGSDLTAVITGGFANIVAPHCYANVTCDENLMLDGLMYVCSANTGSTNLKNKGEL